MQDKIQEIMGLVDDVVENAELLAKSSKHYAALCASKKAIESKLREFDKDWLNQKLDEGVTGGPHRCEFAYTEHQVRHLHAENERLRKVLSALIAGYEDTERKGMMDMAVIGEDVQEAVRILGISQEKQEKQGC